jgi:hypothetical protein
MKVLQILIIIGFGLVVSANAQLCGSYRTTLMVVGKTGKPITNAKIRIVPQQTEDQRHGKQFVSDSDDPSRFTISFNEGHIVGGKYKVVVTASDFSALCRKDIRSRVETASFRNRRRFSRDH